MNTKYWMLALPAAFTMMTANLAHADVGMMDGADAFRDFQSTKSRAEVRAELAADQNQAYPVTDGTGFREPNIGARGVAGSRYSQRTREEVMNELQEYQRTHDRHSPNDIYFGG